MSKLKMHYKNYIRYISKASNIRHKTTRMYYVYLAKKEAEKYNEILHFLGGPYRIKGENYINMRSENVW